MHIHKYWVIVTLYIIQCSRYFSIYLSSYYYIFNITYLLFLYGLDCNYTNKQSPFLGSSSRLVV